MADAVRDYKLDEKLDKLEKKIDCILEILETKVSKECEKMSTHIDFIDKVYEKVKNPLNFITNKINHVYIKNDSNI